LELVSLIIAGALGASLYLSFISFSCAFIVSKIYIRVPCEISKLRTIAIFFIVVFIGTLLDIAKSIVLQVNKQIQYTSMTDNSELRSILTLLILIILFILSFLILIQQHYYLEDKKRLDTAIRSDD
jgi:hypothetical protein